MTSEETKIERVAKAAAKEAIAALKAEEKKNRKVKIYQNTKALMENYQRMVKSVQEGVSSMFRSYRGTNRGIAG